jgi:hypothetical protein
MAFKLEQQLQDNIADEVGLCLQEMRAIPTWSARKFELFAKFGQLARKKRYLLFTADVRDYLLYGSGNSCLLDVPLNQRGALKKFAGMRIRLVCGGKSNRYSGRFYYAKQVSKDEREQSQVQNRRKRQN